MFTTQCNPYFENRELSKSEYKRLQLSDCCCLV